MKRPLLITAMGLITSGLSAQSITSTFSDPTGQYSTYSSGICLFCSISNADQVSDMSLTSGASVVITAGVLYSRTVRAKLPSVAPAFSNAGFFVNTFTVLAAMPTVTITTYKAGAYRETLLTNGNLLTILTATTSFVCGAANATMDFDEVGITFNSNLASVAMTANLMYAFAGPAYCSITLPVNFESFNVNQQKGYPELQWAAQDQGDAVYEIQRSSNSKDFKKVAVMVSDETAKAKTFTYTDYDATDSLVYYRIGLKAHAESEEIWTKIIAYRTGSGAPMKELVIYPNPVQTSVTIRVPKPSTQYAIEIMDLRGTSVEHQTINGDAGSETVAVNLQHNLRPGFYILRVKGNNDTEEYHSRFIKR